ncbi:MAG: pyridine nucleotide-disulfide oxidoreductase [Paenibacillus sp.]|nr:pyridine nucleotide-disulfide oxidoreductase [Paenibacillus sp.]
MVDLIIIGAGPYGISLAAHAEAQGLSYDLLGEPMRFWSSKMPQNMFIRTNPRFISLSDPADKWTIDRFGLETGTELISPFPRPSFVEYAFWFARKTGIAFTPELVSRIDYVDSAYAVMTNSGNRYWGANAVVATGLQHFSYTPETFSSLPASLVSHTFGQTEFTRFRGRKVAVVGSGQSAWETAALLHMAGSEAELLFRGEEVQFAGEDNTSSGLKLIESSEQFYGLPLEQKRERWNTPRKGSVALFLKPYVDGKVKATGNASIEHAEVIAGGQVRLTLSGGDKRVVDHVLCATGYRINLDKLPFIGRALLEAIDREEGYPHFPLLSERFESSVPGLYFAGPLASHTHGPAFGFVAGLRQACRSIIPHIRQTQEQSKRRGV